MANESDKINISLSDMTDEDKKTLFDLIKKYSLSDKDHNKGFEKWIPDVGEWYYYVSYDNVSLAAIREEDDDYVANLLKARNIFKTEEQAKFESERRKVLCELKNFADEHNDSDINWNNKQEKHFIYYCYSSKELETSFVYSCKRIGNEIFFTSQEIVESAIEHVGKNRILTYVFGFEVDESEEK